MLCQVYGGYIYPHAWTDCCISYKVRSTPGQPNTQFTTCVYARSAITSGQRSPPNADKRDNLNMNCASQPTYLCFLTLHSFNTHISYCSGKYLSHRYVPWCLEPWLQVSQSQGPWQYKPWLQVAQPQVPW